MLVPSRNCPFLHQQLNYHNSAFLPQIHNHIYLHLSSQLFCCLSTEDFAVATFTITIVDWLIDWLDIGINCSQTYYFLVRDMQHICRLQRAICCRPSVCPSVRLSHGWISQKRLKYRIMQLSPQSSPMTLVSSGLTSSRNSTKGNIGSGGAEWERGIGKVRNW